MAIEVLILTVLGLALFETITSIDNAIINAEVLSKMSEKARRWFLLWGLIIAVLIVRGLLPSLILWSANPSLTIDQVVAASLNGDHSVVEAIEKTGPILLIGGGIFLIFLFFHWLFLEHKNYGLYGEQFFHSQGVWFFAVISIILTFITWNAIQVNNMMAFGAVVGSTAFFIVHGFKQNAELREKELLEGKSSMSDLSKLLYLEVIDMTFSIDGVIGAFAFTFSIPLILIGNGIGAFMVRELTLRNIENVKKYVYLKNGAMYSILVLGVVMVLDSFGYHIPEWLSPVATFAIVGYFFWKSIQHIKNV
ncbi:DUF475 domain-containing protein, partial [Candidatus Micrarchaeota archaeon]|nr:DUF475 domain-containing protein [Candidatus Micrarchaeota archaeon]